MVLHWPSKPTFAGSTPAARSRVSRSATLDLRRLRVAFLFEAFMPFLIRLLAGLAIAGLSILASNAAPQYAWGIGWLGCWLYFVSIVRR